jgi:hypothetical protein
MVNRYQLIAEALAAGQFSVLLPKLEEACLQQDDPQLQIYAGEVLAILESRILKPIRDADKVIVFPAAHSTPYSKLFEYCRRRLAET